MENYYDSWEYQTSKWLESIDSEDRESIKILLSELIIEDTFIIQSSLRSAISRKMKEETRHNVEAIVLPIVDLKYKEEDPHTAFVDLNPIDKLSIQPGSEAQVAHWLRNQNLSSFGINGSPDLSNLDFASIYKKIINGGILNFICVTDFILSGSEVIKFTQTLVELSNYFEKKYSKKIRIEVLCHAISRKAIEEIIKNTNIHNIIFHKYIKTLDDLFWIPESRKKDIILKCEKYTKYFDDDGFKVSSDLGHYLGYKKTGSLSITDSFLPDNTPALFWKSNPKRYKSNFYPLFPNRYSLTPRRSSHTNKTSNKKIIDKLNLGRIESFLLSRQETTGKFTIDLTLLSINKYGSLYFSQICTLFNAPAATVKKTLESAKNTSLINYSYEKKYGIYDSQYIPYDWKIEITEEGESKVQHDYKVRAGPRTYNNSKYRDVKLDRNNPLTYYMS